MLIGDGKALKGDGEALKGEHEAFNTDGKALWVMGGITVDGQGVQDYERAFRATKRC